MDAVRLYHLSFHNLKFLHDHQLESCHRKEFLDENDHFLSEPSELLNFLGKVDLLETEQDPNVFFLTPEAYDLIEDGTLSFYLLDELGLEEEDIYPEEKSRDLSYHHVGQEKKAEKKPYLNDMPWYIYPFVFAIILLIMNWMFGLSLDSNYSPPSNKKIDLENVIRNTDFIEQTGDTIRMTLDPEKRDSTLK